MVAPDIEKQLSVSFGPQVLESPDLVSKLGLLLDTFTLSVEDLYLHWETLCVSKAQENLELTLDNLDKLQQYIQEQLGKSNTEKRKPVFRNVMVGSSPSAKNLNSGVPSTPSLKRRRMDETPPFKTPKERFDSSPIQSDYGTANNTFVTPSTTTEDSNPVESNTILESLNPNIEPSSGYLQLAQDESTSIKPFTIAANFDAAKYKFRTMSMKLLESADVLDEQIDSATQLYQEANPGVNFGNPCLTSQFPLIACGRIVPDSPLYDSNQMLNSTSLFLETSRFGGIGQRVALDINAISEYSFFPGQIVVLKGTNPSGKTFVVEQVFELPDLGASVSSAQELNEFNQLTTESNGLKIMVIAGPYSNHHNLDFTKLEKLVDKINQDIIPHTVIMFGPFLDLLNDSVANGDFKLSEVEMAKIKNLDDVFKSYIVPIIKKINPRISVIMIPSVRDVTSKHASYPQSAFNRKSYGLPKNVKVFPNPSSFSINEVVFGCSNLDIFKDLKDVYKGGKNVLSNRFERISNHIFEQRRYYPFFPGSVRPKLGNSEASLSNGLMGDELTQTAIGGATLEVPYMGLAELGDSLPDILIVPSELKYFAKVVKGVIVINPGYFIRANKVPTKEDGSYAIININPPSISDENSVIPVGKDDLYYHNVCGRSRVDIYRS